MSNYVLLGVKSGNLSFIFGRPIICKTLKHIDHWHNRSRCVLCFKGFSRLITDWLVENVNPDMTSNRILLDVSVLPKKNNN